MNIKLNHSEMVEIVRQFYRIDPNLQLTVELEAVSNHLIVYQSVLKKFPAYRSSQKIEAIKDLRNQIAGLGLADAKYIIEAYSTDVETYFNKNGSLLNFYNHSR